MGTPEGRSAGAAGPLTIPLSVGAVTRVAVAFGDFTSNANCPTASGWKLLGLMNSRALYVATTTTPGTVWTITTGLAAIMTWGYDREVAIDMNPTFMTVTASTLNATRGALVTRLASGVTEGVPNVAYPAGHSQGQAFTQWPLGGPYLFNAIASMADDDGGSVGPATFTFGSAVIGAAQSVPDPMAMTFVAYEAKPAFTPVAAGSGVVWQDEFNDATLDLSKWAPTYSPPSKFNATEEQAYTPRASNIQLTGSELRLRGLREAFSADGITAQWTSGRITSRQMFRYGEYRSRIWVPAGKGLWPAFWLLGNERAGWGGWPAIGEWDIMETFGNTGTLITAAHGVTNAGAPWTYDAQYTGATLSTGWYEFWGLWTTTGLTWGVDTTTLGSYTKATATAAGRAWPFDNPHHIILNLAVGGSSWGGATDGTTPSVNEMRVDWVRVSNAEVYAG